MIDYKLRTQLAGKRQGENFMQGVFKSTSDAIKLKEENQEIMQAISRKDSLVKESFDKLGQAITMLYKAVLNNRVEFPKIFQVKGEVEVTRTPAVEIKNFNELTSYLVSLEKQLQKQKFPSSLEVENLSELKTYFTSLETQIKNLSYQISSMPTPRVEMPAINFPKFDFPKGESVNLTEVVEAIKDLEGKLVKQPQAENTVGVLRKINEGIQFLANRPQFEATPVTNVNINALQGFVKTTSQTVGTSLTAVPAYGQLFNRRSVIIFNNDSTNTVYIGGSDVTTVNGLPVLAQTFSPSIDAGYNMIIYAIAATNVNIRVLEVSKDQTANVQE